ncbi:unnamed protein product [Peronospora belbahrii]|uniref:Inhibitor of growth protein N-terminal histone-binding domain-containing protein n=1 Tax=Peronospora belbahrii TaxID=622444 RepID=A0ABN8D2K0_9STRA|nr:unnamed protein product [Peronospora belbahrii]
MRTYVEDFARCNDTTKGEPTEEELQELIESYAALLRANGEYQEDSRPQRKKQKTSAATTTVHQLHYTSQSPATPYVTSIRSKQNTSGAVSAGMKDKSTIPVVSKASSAGSALSRKKSIADTTVAMPQVATDQYEWFHFSCVGLTDQPAGKWYCHDCKTQLGIK